MLLAVMLTVSVCYFAVLPSTTAWVIDTGYVADSYDVPDIDTTFSTGSGNNVTLDFKAASKFTDDDERANYFEHTVQFLNFTVTNNVDADSIDALLTFEALKYDNVGGTTSALTAADGLRWFWYEYTDTAAEAGTVTQLVDGVYVNSTDKRVLPDGTGGYFTLNPTLTSALETAMVNGGKAVENAGEVTVNSAFVSDNSAQTAFLAANNTTTLALNVGQTKKICVAFWVEYDFFKAKIDGGAGSVNYDIKFNVIPVQAANYS